MVNKANNDVLNLVSPPIDRLVLRRGTLDNVVIGANVPNVGFFTALTDTALASPLVGAPTGLLSQVVLGSMLEIRNIDGVDYLTVVDDDSGPPPVSPVSPVSPPPVSPPGPSSNAILREDGSYELREDSSRILREHDGA